MCPAVLRGRLATPPRHHDPHGPDSSEGRHSPGQVGWQARRLWSVAKIGRAAGLSLPADRAAREPGERRGLLDIRLLAPCCSSVTTSSPYLWHCYISIPVVVFGGLRGPSSFRCSFGLRSGPLTAAAAASSRPGYTAVTLLARRLAPSARRLSLGTAGTRLVETSPVPARPTARIRPRAECG